MPQSENGIKFSPIWNRVLYVEQFWLFPQIPPDFARHGRTPQITPVESHNSRSPDRIHYPNGCWVDTITSAQPYQSAKDHCQRIGHSPGSRLRTILKVALI